MSEQQNPIASWKGVLVVAIVVVAVTFVVRDLAQRNKGFSLGLDKDGKFTISVSPDDSFAEVFKKAIDKNVAEVDAILAGEQYYSLTNAKLVDELENADFSQPRSQEIAKRLRRMLWDLRGPFGVPGALRGADGRMAEALDDLENALQDAKQVSPLLVELWKRTLDQEGIFKQRLLVATVEIVQRAPAGSRENNIILACPGSALMSGRVMTLFTDYGSISGEVNQNPSLFDCDGPALTAEKLLAGSTARLGLSETAFRQLFDPEGKSGMGVGRSDAKFFLFPKNLVGWQQSGK